MKTLLSLVALTLASAVTAQPPGNRVYSNNDPLFVICTCTNASTGRSRQWMGTMHPSYEARGQAVPAGDLEWKIFKAHEYHRGDSGAAVADQPIIDGWEATVRQSAANPMGSTNVYWSFSHQFMTGVKVDTTPGIRNPGVQVIPDLSVPLVDFGPEVQDGASVTGHTRRLAAAAARPTPVLLPGDFAFITAFKGGENDFVASDATGGVVSQHNVGSANDGQTMGGAHGYTHDQFGFSDAAAGGASIVYQTSLPWSFGNVDWATFSTVQPSLAIQSDYGGGRAGSSTLRGESLGSYHADAVSEPFALNYTIQGGAAFANGLAIPLINIAPAEFATVTRVPVSAGQTLHLYLDPNDPLFATLASALAAALDAGGDYRPPASQRIAFPRLPRQLLFWHWSWQAVLVDRTGTRFANTERRSIKIES